jgi:serine/threonine-protein kinase HipA
MSVAGKNRHRRIADIRRRHWNATARACGITDGAEPWIIELLDRVEPAIAEVQARLPADYPDQVATSIFNGLRQAADRLAAMQPEA